MGLLSLGTPLSWQDVAKYADHVREHGIAQLLSTLNKYKDRKDDKLLWGDEVEYMVVKLEKDGASLVLNQEKILGQLMDVSGSTNVSYHPEYGRYMVEATPKHPFGPSLLSVLELEDNMKLRRDIAADYLGEGEHLLTITSYPRLGVGCFANTREHVGGAATKSLFLPDDIINLHPRFPTLSANIRKRRGKKVEITVPVFEDTRTPVPWKDPVSTIRPEGVSSEDIYMDAMGFGMGCCCLQLTFQGSDIDQARDLYDALAPLTPIMLALSAASPIFRGILSDQDVRWNVVSASVDDRTDEEKSFVAKSRYDSIDCYISRNNAILHSDLSFFNDIPVRVNPKVTSQLAESKLLDGDPLLIQHFSHLFIRDPLVVFEELIHQDDSACTDHFENIQSTNWQTMRFKPPPNDQIGWRVEFRPMEIQFTDFENAAYSVFIVLMTRVILSQNRCFYQPISQVDQNMKRAHWRDPVNSAKFWFRTNTADQSPSTDPGIRSLTIDEIINGGQNFEGLLPMIRQFLRTESLDATALHRIERYLDLVSKRASGELITDAEWIRNFVRTHPDYKFDSVVSESTNRDLLETIGQLGSGQNWAKFAKGLLL